MQIANYEQRRQRNFRRECVLADGRVVSTLETTVEHTDKFSNNDHQTTNANLL